MTKNTAMFICPVQNRSGIINPDWKIDIKKCRWSGLFTVFSYTFCLSKYVILLLYVMNSIHWILSSLLILLNDKTHGNVYLRSTKIFWFYYSWLNKPKTVTVSPMVHLNFCCRLSSPNLTVQIRPFLQPKVWHTVHF